MNLPIPGRPRRLALILLTSLALSACGTLADLGDRVILQPLGQVARAVGLAGDTVDVCTRTASLVNPATLEPGVGSTGAPAGVVVGNPGGIGGTGNVAQRPGVGGTGQVVHLEVGDGGLVQLAHHVLGDARVGGAHPVRHEASRAKGAEQPGFAERNDQFF